MCAPVRCNLNAVGAATSVVMVDARWMVDGRSSTSRALAIGKEKHTDTPIPRPVCQKLKTELLVSKLL